MHLTHQKLTQWHIFYKELESSTLCSASKIFTVTFSLLELKTVSDVFVYTLTQHCCVWLMSNWYQSSACIPAADENWQIWQLSPRFTHSQYIVIQVIQVVPVSSPNNGYQMDKLVHRIVLPLLGDVVLNHKLVSRVVLNLELI